MLGPTQAAKLRSQITSTLYYDFLNCGHEGLEPLDCTNVTHPPPSPPAEKNPLPSLDGGIKYFGIDDIATQWYLHHKKNRPKPCKTRYCYKYRVPIRHLVPRECLCKDLPLKRVSPEFLDLLMKNQTRTLPRRYQLGQPSFSYYKYDAGAKSRHMRPGIDTAAPLEFPCKNLSCPRRLLTPQQIDALGVEKLRCCAMVKKQLEKVEEAKKEEGPPRNFLVDMRENRDLKRVNFILSKNETYDYIADEQKDQKEQKNAEVPPKADDDGLPPCEPEDITKDDKAKDENLEPDESEKAKQDTWHGIYEVNEMVGVTDEPDKVKKKEKKIIPSALDKTNYCLKVQPKRKGLGPCEKLICPKSEAVQKRMRDPRYVVYENSPYYQVLKANRHPSPIPTRRHQYRRRSRSRSKSDGASSEERSKRSEYIERKSPTDLSEHGFYDQLRCHRKVFVKRSEQPEESQPSDQPSEDCMGFQSFIKRSDKENIEHYYKTRCHVALKDECREKKRKKLKPYCYLWSTVDPDIRAAEKERRAEMACRKKKREARSKPKPYCYLWSRVDPDVRANAKRKLTESEAESEAETLERKRERMRTCYLWSQNEKREAEKEREKESERIELLQKARQERWQRRRMKKRGRSPPPKPKKYTQQRTCYMWSKTDHKAEDEAFSKPQERKPSIAAHASDSSIIESTATNTDAQSHRGYYLWSHGAEETDYDDSAPENTQDQKVKPSLLQNKQNRKRKKSVRVEHPAEERKYQPVEYDESTPCARTCRVEEESREPEKQTRIQQQETKRNVQIAESETNLAGSQDHMWTGPVQPNPYYEVPHQVKEPRDYDGPQTSRTSILKAQRLMGDVHTVLGTEKKRSKVMWSPLPVQPSTSKKQQPAKQKRNEKSNSGRTQSVSIDNSARTEDTQRFYLWSGPMRPREYDEGKPCKKKSEPPPERSQSVGIVNISKDDPRHVWTGPVHESDYGDPKPRSESESPPMIKPEPQSERRQTNYMWSGPMHESDYDMNEPMPRPEPEPTKKKSDVQPIKGSATDPDDPRRVYLWSSPRSESDSNKKRQETPQAKSSRPQRQRSPRYSPVRETSYDYHPKPLSDSESSKRRPQTSRAKSPAERRRAASSYGFRRQSEYDRSRSYSRSKNRSRRRTTPERQSPATSRATRRMRPESRRPAHTSAPKDTRQRLKPTAKRSDSTISCSSGYESPKNEPLDHYCLEEERRETRAQREWEERQRKKKCKPKPVPSNDWIFTSRAKHYSRELEPDLRDPGLFVHRSKKFPIAKERSKKNDWNIVDQTEEPMRRKANAKPQPQQKTDDWFLVQPSGVDPEEYEDEFDSRAQRPRTLCLRPAEVEIGSDDDSEHCVDIKGHSPHLYGYRHDCPTEPESEPAYPETASPPPQPEPSRRQRCCQAERNGFAMCDSDRSENCRNYERDRDRDRDCNRQPCRRRNRSMGGIGILTPHNFAQSLEPPLAGDKREHYKPEPPVKPAHCHAFCF